MENALLTLLLAWDLSKNHNTLNPLFNFLCNLASGVKIERLNNAASKIGETHECTTVLFR